MTLDLSAVTDSLIGLVKSQWTTAPIWSEAGRMPAGPAFTPSFTGLAPDAARQQPGTQLSMYLYHVEPDNAREALFWQPQMLGTSTGQPAQFLPLALDLFYLLFAYSETSYAEEQEAMSAALRVFHANPIVRSDPRAAAPWELSLTVERRSYDELSRLWQATTVPLRMSLVYRAAVVFIDPEPMPPPAPDPQRVVVGAFPAPLAGQLSPAVLGTLRDGSYQPPTGPPVPFSQSPATVAAGQTAWLIGSGLGVTGVSDHVYLLPGASGTETDVTAWAVAADSTAARFVLTLPPAAGSPPAQSPAPGVYQLRAGSGPAGAAGATRTGSTPISIAAYVDPAGGPVISGSAPYTVHGAGFLPGATEVLVGMAGLAATGSAPAPGEFSVDPSGTSFAFSPPAGPAGTVAPVRVRVNGIESDPALWVTL
ncbi:MAG: DUF4255 domain-containing protein [Streptosporangiaceae bacterium]